MFIKSVQLLDYSLLHFGRFNAIIGPNSTGKSTLLAELFFSSAGLNKHPWFWTKNIVQWGTDDIARDIDLFLASLDKQYINGNYTYFLSSLRSADGRIQRDGTELNQLQWDAMHEAKQRVASHRDAVISDLMTHALFKRASVTYESCENRLLFPENMAVNSLSVPTTDEINLLYRNKALLASLNEKFSNQFGLKLVVLDHNRTNLDFGISQDNPPQFDYSAEKPTSEYQRIEEWKNRSFTPISTTGHGIRSIVRLLLSMVLPHYQIIMIDEPEMHIYPAQKRWLGRQLADLAGKFNKQVFLATHDPILLQGILDSHYTTTIFRADRIDHSRRSLRSCTIENKADVGAKRNQDSYLQCLFYQRTIVVEGATDRAFYQTMIEEICSKQIEGKDIGFVSSGGKGGAIHMAQIASQIGLNVVFVFDFDVLLFDVPLLQNILQLRQKASKAVERLHKYYQDQFRNDSNLIKKESGDAKRKGVGSAFVMTHKSLFEDVSNELEAAGIITVPYGSLESWALEIDDKARFAERAPEIILANVELKQRLEEFLSKLLSAVGCP